MKNDLSHKPDTRERSLEERLQNSRPNFVTSSGFTGRVMNYLDARPSPAPAPETRPGFTGFRAFLTVASAVAVFIFVAQWLYREPGHDVAAGTSELPRLMTARLPDLSLERVDALTAKLDEPLERELKFMISDTRQAIQFVASNFLPEN